MATPPFVIATTLPGDSDITSQYPAVERTFRDIVNSWLLIDHNNLGQHVQLSMPWGVAPTAPISGLTEVFANPLGSMKVITVAGDERFIGPPPGAVFWTGGGVPNGYLLCQGQAVSRTTYSELFGAISTTFGVGDGTTTFNIPNLQGRVVAGPDNGLGLLTSAGLGTAAVLAAVGGTQTHTLILAELPTGIQVNGTVAVTVVSNDTDILVTPSGITSSGAAGGGNAQLIGTSGSVKQVTSTGNNNFTGFSVNTSNTAHSIVQPTIILNPIIKF